MHAWTHDAIARIEADFTRSADTHLLRVDLPALRGVDLYLKDESTHPTGSLKHRLARSLFLYGLCNGWIREGTTIIEASSGSTAVSEAYFARLLGLDFVAVMPRSTSPEKVAQIRFYGGRTHLVDDPTEVYDASQRLARETGGHFMDQFTYAERATDWRGNNSIAESVFAQMVREPHPVPAWVVCGAGTGGTSASLGRFARYRRLDTRVCVVDPENSVFYDYFVTRDPGVSVHRGSRVEGIGRPRAEPSFLPDVIDRVMRVPDAATVASLRFLERVLGRRCGGSTGTNLWGSLVLAHEMQRAGRRGSIVTLLCDTGDRYAHTYFDDGWVSAQGLVPAPYAQVLERFAETGIWNVDALADGEFKDTR